MGGFYYFNPSAASPYVFGGLGWSGWSTPREKNEDSWVGPGFTLGVGYEFSKHFSVQLNMLSTNPSKELGSLEAGSGTITEEASTLGFQLNIVAIAY